MLPLLLAIAWAVVLLPPIIQRLLATRSSTPADALGALARRHRRLTDGAPAATVEVSSVAATAMESMPRSAPEAEARRRFVGIVLGGAAFLSLLAVPFVGALALLVHLAVDAALAGFAFLWWQRGQHLDATTASVVALSSLRPSVRARPAMAPQPVRRAG